jgi:hypothetical protein
VYGKKDSTSFDTDGTATSMNYQQPGVVGYGMEWTSSSSLLNMGNPSDGHLDFGTGDFTLGIWVKVDQDIGWEWIVSKGAQFSSDIGYGLISDDTPVSNWRAITRDPTLVEASPSDFSLAEWNYIVCRLDRATDLLYIYGNGTQDATGDASALGNIDNSKSLRLPMSPSYYFDGWVDEFRLTNLSRSANWIQTEYINYHDPSSFYTVGSEYELDTTPPVINNFGVEDPGTGIGTFWANITDAHSGVDSALLKINGTEYSMSSNGTHWIKQLSVNFTGYYEYQIINASDIFGNYLTVPSSNKNYTFNFDTVAPDVLDWEYYDDTGPYGTFKANVSDSWGVIDMVIVNVTEGTILNVTEGTILAGESWAEMWVNASGYLNDTIEMDTGTIKFTITVNDTAGNSFTSSEHQGYVPIVNNPPEASALTLSRDENTVLQPIFSNNTLYLNYTYYDSDSDPEAGTEIRWYKNNVQQAGYDDQQQIPASALIKGDEWNVTVKPKDNQEFGTLQTSETITIQNTAPTLTNVIVTPSNPNTASDLTVNYDYSDEDSDSEVLGNRLIRWYNNSNPVAAYDDNPTVPASATKKGQQWYYQIRVNDGANNSIWYTSNTETIINTAPTASDVDITASPKTDDNLVASWTYNDVDGDSENTNWHIWWYKNDAYQSNLDDVKIVNSGNTSKGEIWKYVLQVFDGTAYSGNYTLTPTVQIQNTPPTIAGDPYIIISNPQTDDDLVGNWTFVDVDGDNQSAQWIIRWYKDGTLQSAYNDEDTVPSTATSKGEEWNFTVKVYDGTDYSIQ